MVAICAFGTPATARAQSKFHYDARTADIADWVADVCGAVLGLAVYSVTFRPLRAALHRWRAWRAG